MILTRIQKPAKVVNLPDLSQVQIYDHVEKDGIITFFYDFPLAVNKNQVSSATGDYQINVFNYQKKTGKITIKQSQIAGSNFLKSADRQRFAQRASFEFEKRYFLKKFISYSDLSSDRIPFQIEITGDQVFDKFVVELVNVSHDGFSQTVDKTEVDHARCLKLYDLPSEEFRITSALAGNRLIFVAASTDDKNVGAFNFSIKKNTGITMVEEKFSLPTTRAIDVTNIATAQFSVPDNGQRYLIRVNPVSKITNQEIGNFKEIETGESQSEKMLAFYVSEFENDRIEFVVTTLPKSVKKLFLYRQKFGSNDREFISSIENTSSSVTLEDSGRISQYDFLYSLDYQNETGEMKTSATEIFVPALRLDSLAKINVARKVSNTPGQRSSQSLAFDVSVTYDISTPYDQITEDIKSMGLESLFSTDIQKMTNNIKPLMRVIVTKISLITGFESFIGIFPPGEITVSNPGEEPAIFRFEVAVKSVPDALESIASAQNLISNNSFNLGSPTDLSSKLIGNRFKSAESNYSAKFFSKSSLKGSTLLYGESEEISSLGYYSGRTGIFGDIKVFPSAKSKTSVISQRLLETRKGYFLSWFLPQSLENITHFTVTVDGIQHMSHPTQKSEQIFFIGKNRPKNFTIYPVSQDPNLPTDPSDKGL